MATRKRPTLLFTLDEAVEHLATYVAPGSDPIMERYCDVKAELEEIAQRVCDDAQLLPERQAAAYIKQAEKRLERAKREKATAAAAMLRATWRTRLSLLAATGCIQRVQVAGVTYTSLRWIEEMRIPLPIIPERREAEEPDTGRERPSGWLGVLAKGDRQHVRTEYERDATLGKDLPHGGTGNIHDALCWLRAHHPDHYWVMESIWLRRERYRDNLKLLAQEADQSEATIRDYRDKALGLYAAHKRAQEAHIDANLGIAAEPAPPPQAKVDGRVLRGEPMRLQVLQTLQQLYTQNGNGATTREIMKAMDSNSTSGTEGRLKKLAEQGRIVHQGGRWIPLEGA